MQDYVRAGYSKMLKCEENIYRKLLRCYVS